MGLLAFLNHLLNFLAPAAALAVLVTLMARLFIRKSPPAIALSRQVAINFIVSAAVLTFGLWLFGRDGKMNSYLAMTLICATSQWLMLRGWRA